jgi:ubiquitin-protein ligase E3 C
MFQSFTGNSRRPRQVNLSGQEPNLFAAWGSSPTASGIQKTVAVAQAERQHRQQERDRLNATKRIQRTWRGHRSRRNLANMRRQEWDDLENDGDEQDSLIPFKVNQQLRLLLAFFSADDAGDIGRLSRFGDRLLKARKKGYLSERDIRPQLYRLANIILASLVG